MGFLQQYLTNTVTEFLPGGGGPLSDLCMFRGFCHEKKVLLLL